MDSIVNKENLSGGSDAKPAPLTARVAPPIDLDKHLRDLIGVNEDTHLVFSFFLDLTDAGGVHRQLRKLGHQLEAALDMAAVMELFEAEAAILDKLGQGLDEPYAGLACHCRAGAEGFLRLIAFHVPFRPIAVANSHPHILPLIELRDSYDRYVVLISTEQKARILEIVLGSVTREAWLERPELRKRVGREWTREHYQNHRRDRDRQFIREKIRLLEELMNQAGHTHLILAGSNQRIAMIEKELPESLRKRVVDVCRIGVNDPREKVVAETIQSFIEQEAYESQMNLERLQTAILQGSGAVVGLDDCEAALQAGVIDTLIATASEDKPAHRLSTYPHRSPCGDFLTVEKRFEQLLQRAIAQEVPVEFVPRGSFLDDYAGCGALLRYRGAEHVVAR